MLKKRVAALALLFMGCAGVVQAASIHGDYNGDPIVTVTSAGKELHVDDTPAVIRNGHAMVPLYLLEQIGVSVKWDPENYNVELTLPDSGQETGNQLQAFNAKAKDYDASNVKLIYNEYGPYLQADLEQANDSNKDNDHILALSGFLTDSPADALVVDTYHNDRLSYRVVVPRTDAIRYRDRQMSEYDFTKTWRLIQPSSAAELDEPNKPPEAVSTAPYIDNANVPNCMTILANFQRQQAQMIRDYNRGDLSNPHGINDYLKSLIESTNAVLKDARCSLIDSGN